MEPEMLPLLPEAGMWLKLKLELEKKRLALGKRNAQGQAQGRELGKRYAQGQGKWYAQGQELEKRHAAGLVGLPGLVKGCSSAAARQGSWGSAGRSCCACR